MTSLEYCRVDHSKMTGTYCSECNRQIVQSSPTYPKPEWRKVLDVDSTRATPMFFVVCNEGWRETIVCGKMYESAADWLIEQLQGRPFNPEMEPIPGE